MDDRVTREVAMVNRLDSKRMFLSGFPLPELKASQVDARIFRRIESNAKP
jgi:hypothetical protein